MLGEASPLRVPFVFLTCGSPELFESLTFIMIIVCSTETRVSIDLWPLTLGGSCPKSNQFIYSTESPEVKRSTGVSCVSECGWRRWKGHANWDRCPRWRFKFSNSLAWWIRSFPIRPHSEGRIVRESTRCRKSLCYRLAHHKYLSWRCVDFAITCIFHRPESKCTWDTYWIG